MPRGSGEVIHCLALNKNDLQFSEACRAQVIQFQMVSNVVFVYVLIVWYVHACVYVHVHACVYYIHIYLRNSKFLNHRIQ